MKDQDQHVSSCPSADGGISDLASRLLSPFGQERIQELSGNATFARGAFGELSVGIRNKKGRSNDDDDDNPFVAIKTIENAMATPPGRSFGFSSLRQKSSLSREVLNEVLALRHLHPHPNVVSLLAMYPPPRRSEFDSTRSLALVFPYSPIDLYQALEWRRRNEQPRRRQQPSSLLPFPVIRTVLEDVLNAVAHCHANGVLHRDVKPGNLLLSQDGVVQLCDFGLAKPYAVEENGNTHRLPVPATGASGTKGLCTLFYRPPEVLFGASASHPSVDLYSAGLVLAELMVGAPLWQGNNVLGQLSIVFDALGTPNEETWPTVKELPDYVPFGSKQPQPWTKILPRGVECPALLEMVSKLVVLNPHDRLSAQQSLQFLGSVDEAVLSKASRAMLQKELIQPSSLKIPSVSSTENDDDDTLSNTALELAKQRRTFLSDRDDKEEGPTKTLEELLAEFSKKDLATLVKEQQQATADDDFS